MIILRRTAILACAAALAACEQPEQQVLGPSDPQMDRGGNRTAWEENTPMTLPREGTCQVIVNDRLYVTHGFGPPSGDSNSNQIYDIAKDSWTMGTPATVRRSEGVGVEHGGRVFCIGGRGFDPLSPSFGVLPSVEIYHVGTDTWTRGTPMPTPRAGLAAAVVGDRIYALGGRNGSAPRSGTPLNLNEVYDIAHDTWTVAAPMPVAVMDVDAVAHGGRIYVPGGYNQAVCGGPCNLLQIYHAATDTWRLGAPMPTARSSLAVAAKGNTVYAIAGATRSARLTSVNEAYDIDKDVWREAPPKPTPTAETFANMHGGEIFIVGGGFFGAGFSPVPGAVNESFRPLPGAR